MLKTNLLPLGTILYASFNGHRMEIAKVHSTYYEVWDLDESYDEPTHAIYFNDIGNDCLYTLNQK